MDVINNLIHCREIYINFKLLNPISQAYKHRRDATKYWIYQDDISKKQLNEKIKKLNEKRVLDITKTKEHLDIDHQNEIRAKKYN